MSRELLKGLIDLIDESDTEHFLNFGTFCSRRKGIARRNRGN